MTTQTAPGRTFPAPGRVAAGPDPSPSDGGPRWSVRTGQLVVTQVAVVLVVAGAMRGTIAVTAAAAVAVALLALTWSRWRGRWAFEWLDVAARYAVRRRSGALLDLAAPGVRPQPAELGGDPSAVLVDGAGVTAVLELGDPTGLLAEDLPPLPALLGLLPAPGPEHPPCRLQLVLTGAPGPVVRNGNGIPANSYRQLTDGRLLGHSRALLAVRVLSAEGWSGDDLERALSSLVRKIPKRLGALPARPLGEAAVTRVLAELAHDDGRSPVQETWSGLRTGPLTQATFRLRRWPDLRVETSRRLVPRLLTLPAAATTVAMSVGPHPESGPTGATIDLTVRLAADDPPSLALAAQALHRLLAGERAAAWRLDGEHLPGLAATLPLGGSPLTHLPGRAAAGAQPAAAASSLDVPVSPAGLMIGNNRHGDPVVTRLFRPEQTRALLIGGVRCAQLVTLRAMALGARVVVQTARPQAWEPFVRGTTVPGESIAVVPPGRGVDVPPGTALHPLLVVVDIGPVGADTRPGAGWQATLVVRDDFSPADVDVASRADLVILQPLRPDEATLVGAAIGLGETATWLTRIRVDMVGLVNRRAVRWAALAQTSIETQLIGPAGR